MPSEEQDQSGKPSLGALSGVAVGVTTLAGVLAAVAFTGVLARTWRNELKWTLGAFALVLLAAATWTAVAVSKAKTGPANVTETTETQATVTVPKPSRLDKFRKWLRTSAPAIGAIALFAGGILLGILAVAFTYGDTEKPTVTAEIEPGLVVKGNVHVAGLSSDEKLAVQVRGFRRKVTQLTAGESPWEGFTVYEASFGPNADGVVEHPIHIALAPGTYELVTVRANVGDEYDLCPPYDVRTPTEDVSESEDWKRRIALKTGCLLLTLPRLDLVPRIRADWKRSGGQSTLAVLVRSGNAPHRVIVHVVAFPQRRLATALLMPDATGGIDEAMKFGVPKGVKRVCAIAQWYPTSEVETGLEPQIPPCPPRGASDTSWVLITAAAAHP
jgi:hypothetical protein